MKNRFAIAVVSCLACFGLAASQSVAAAVEPSFVPSERPGIKISDSNVQLASGDVFSGDARDDLAVLDPDRRSLRLFGNEDGKRLKLHSTAKFRVSVGGWESSMDRSGSGPLGFGVANPFENEVSFLSVPTEDDGEFSYRTIKAGSEPSDSTFLETPLGYRGLMTANQGDDTVSVTTFGRSFEPGLTGVAPVGDRPVAVASGGIFDDAVVANFGSDDVTILGANFDSQGQTLNPAYKVLQTLPVGDQPVEVHAAPFQGADSAGIEFAVVNRGSASVTTIERDESGSYRVIDEYPVGSRPVSITAADLNQDRVADFVVANSGSDDLSLLINDDGELVNGGRIKVGDRPVSVTAMGLNQYFRPDLVVANAGDGVVTSLLWNETSGSCNGRPAKLKKLTPEDDYDYGSSNPNRIFGLGGDDEMRGGRGYDCLFGGSGDDEVKGGIDDDRVWGGPGRDLLSGNNGSDVVRGGAGNDLLCDPYGREDCGGVGAAYGERREVDRLFAGSGDDRVITNEGPNFVQAGPGDDVIEAEGNGFDRVDCGPGRDVVEADRNDRLVDCEIRR